MPYGSIKPIEELHDYLQRSLDTFKADPPDSAYQTGYQDALLEIQKMLVPKEREAA